MTEPTQAPHSNHPSMLNREQPAPFVIVGDAPGGTLTIPITSARTAAQAVRQLTERCPHLKVTWQANPHAGPGPVAVFGCARPSAGEHLPHQNTHAFLLAPGEVLPLVWVALCGHRIGGAQFDALDPGLGRPCPGCHQRWASAHQQKLRLGLA